MMTGIRGSSNALAKRELRWEPKWTSWRDGFRRGLEPTDGAAPGPASGRADASPPSGNASA
jgi:hypothetical protein